MQLNGLLLAFQKQWFAVQIRLLAMRRVELSAKLLS